MVLALGLTGLFPLNVLLPNVPFQNYSSKNTLKHFLLLEIFISFKKLENRGKTGFDHNFSPKIKF